MFKVSLEYQSTRASKPLSTAIEDKAEVASRIIPAAVRLEFDENFERGGIDGEWAPISERQYRKHVNRIGVHGGGGYGAYMVLIYTSRLLKSLTQPSHPEALFEMVRLTSGDIEIRMGTKVPYSRYHMTGFRVKRAIKRGASYRGGLLPSRRRIPARPHIGVATSQIQSFTDMILAEM